MLATSGAPNPSTMAYWNGADPPLACAFDQKATVRRPSCGTLLNDLNEGPHPLDKSSKADSAFGQKFQERMVPKVAERNHRIRPHVKFSVYPKSLFRLLDLW